MSAHMTWCKRCLLGLKIEGYNEHYSAAFFTEGPNGWGGRSSGRFWGVFGLISHERDFVIAVQQSKQVIFYLAWTSFICEAFKFVKAQTRHYAPSGRIPSPGSAVSFPIFTQPFSCISYLGLLRARLVIRVVSQQITKISCCYADLDPCRNVSSHRKTHGWLCVYRKVQSSDQHPSSHVRDLAKWLHPTSADRPIFRCTIFQVRCNSAPRAPLRQMSSLHMSSWLETCSCDGGQCSRGQRCTPQARCRWH